MICPNCQYVFVPTPQPRDMAWRPYCPRCRHLYLEQQVGWHDIREWIHDCRRDMILSKMINPAIERIFVQWHPRLQASMERLQRERDNV